MKENLNSVMEKVYATATAAGDIASKAVDSAGKKAGDIYNVSKLKLKILDIKTDMDILYKEVGKLSFDEYCEEDIDRGRLRGLFLALEDKKKELSELTLALQEAKGKKVCPSCGEENPSQNAYCASCGNEF